jgi:predicted tellurium resistance membrane protein TerC
MLELLTTENLIALLTLTALEIVLGIDNIIFSRSSPRSSRRRIASARGGIGLMGAMLMRIGLCWR